MSSTERSADILAAMGVEGIDTEPEVRLLQRTNRRKIEMSDVIATLKSVRGVSYVSRRRIKHDAICLLKEGQLAESGPFLITDGGDFIVTDAAEKLRV